MQLFENSNVDYTLLLDLHSKTGLNWSKLVLTGFSLSLSSGYGHIAPVTPIGKLVTIFYAIIGMPLFLLYLSNIGDIMATSFKWTYSRLCKCQRSGSSGKGIFGRSAAPQGGGILKNSDSYRIRSLPGQIHSGMFKSVLSDESNSSHLSAAGKVPAEVEVAASEYSIGADDIYQVFI